MSDAQDVKRLLELQARVQRRTTIKEFLSWLSWEKQVSLGPRFGPNLSVESNVDKWIDQWLDLEVELAKEGCELCGDDLDETGWFCSNEDCEYHDQKPGLTKTSNAKDQDHTDIGNCLVGSDIAGNGGQK